MKNLFCNLRFKRCGFTLVEVLVLVLILGILAAVSVPTYQKIIKRSYVADGLKSLDMLAGAQDKYFIENGMYARNLEDLNTPLKGYNNDAKLHNIHTTNFDYNQEQNRYCIKASSNIAAYALVKNYKDKNNIFCIGNDCSEFAKYITEATTDQYAELCPVDENWNNNLTEEEKAKEERGAACQHPCNPFTFTPVTWSDNEPCTNAGKKSGKGIGNGTPGHGQEECKVLEYTTVCENKPGIGWCENKKTSCVPKDCAKYMGAGYHLAGNNYPGYNRCACVKDCGPNTCPVPTCKKQICDPTSGSLPGNGGVFLQDLFPLAVCKILQGKRAYVIFLPVYGNVHMKQNHA